jgi:hypothetical protein
MRRLLLLRSITGCMPAGILLNISEALARKQGVSGHGLLTKYDHIESIYFPQSIVIYIYLHSVYIAAVFDFLHV